MLGIIRCLPFFVTPCRPVSPARACRPSDPRCGLRLISERRRRTGQVRAEQRRERRERYTIGRCIRNRHPAASPRRRGLQDCRGQSHDSVEGDRP